MKTGNKILGFTAILLFIGAGLFWQHSEQIRHQYRWTVLEEPIHLNDGYTLIHEFTVDVAAKYFVEIRCCKTIPYDVIIQAFTNDLKAECIITQGVESIANGESAHAYGSIGYNDAVSTIILNFDAAPHVTYNLTLLMKASADRLRSTRPEVKVSVDPLVYKQSFVRAILFAYPAIGLAIVGSVCTLVLIIKVAAAYLRRKNAHP